MVNQAYNSLNRYFTNLGNTGYIKQSNVNKLLVFLLIQEMVDYDFRGFITREDYYYIDKALYCLYGSNCLIPYPDYYSGKNRKVMYIGSISELSHRIDELQQIISNCKPCSCQCPDNNGGGEDGPHTYTDEVIVYSDNINEVIVPSISILEMEVIVPH